VPDLRPATLAAVPTYFAGHRATSHQLPVENQALFRSTFTCHKRFGRRDGKCVGLLYADQLSLIADVGEPQFQALKKTEESYALGSRNDECVRRDVGVLPEAQAEKEKKKV
jgi:hypothetical protein